MDIITEKKKVMDDVVEEVKTNLELPDVPRKQTTTGNVQPSFWKALVNVEKSQHEVVDALVGIAMAVVVLTSLMVPVSCFGLTGLLWPMPLLTNYATSVSFFGVKSTSLWAYLVGGPLGFFFLSSVVLTLYAAYRSAAY